MFGLSCFGFVSCFCYAVSLLNERGKTEHRFDRYLEHFDSSVASSFFFSFLFPFLLQ